MNAPEMPRQCCNRLSSQFFLFGDATLIPIHYIPSMTLSQLLLSQTEKKALNCCCKSWKLASIAKGRIYCSDIYKLQEKLEGRCVV